jgi:TonB family protein
MKRVQTAAAFLGVLLTAQGRGLAQDAQSPKMEKPELAAERLERNYPEDLRLLAIGGTVRLALRVTPEGRIDSMVVIRPSNIPSLDEAALLTALALPFTKPAERSWTQLTLVFEPDQPSGRVYTDLPQLLNRDALGESARARLRGKVRDPELSANVKVVVTMDSAGKVTDTRAMGVNCRDFVVAALASARTASFNPANIRSTGPRQTILSFALSATSAAIRLPGEGSQAPDASLTVPGADGWRPGSFSTPPALRNKEEVFRALALAYPIRQRNAGMSGAVTLWFLIDEEGTAVKRIIRTSSGDCDFDRAALEVARKMRFHPALLDGKPKRVWVDMPIVFKSS